MHTSFLFYFQVLTLHQLCSAFCELMHTLFSPLSITACEYVLIIFPCVHIFSLFFASRLTLTPTLLCFNTRFLFIIVCKFKSVYYFNAHVYVSQSSSCSVAVYPNKYSPFHLFHSFVFQRYFYTQLILNYLQNADLEWRSRSAVMW